MDHDVFRVVKRLRLGGNRADGAERHRGRGRVGGDATTRDAEEAGMKQRFELFGEVDGAIHVDKGVVKKLCERGTIPRILAETGEKEKPSPTICG